MKKSKVIGTIFLAVALSVGVYAWQSQRLMTPKQELSIYSLASRYLDAACTNPRAIANVVAENVIASDNIITRSVAYLEELLLQENGCYGRSRAELDETLYFAVKNLPAPILELDMATEVSIKDFIECLAGIESEFVDLSDSTRRILSCIELLDIRGFWYNVLVPKQYDHYPIDESPIYPPVVTTPISNPDYDVIVPVPAPVPVELP